jgi:spermidine synthase
LPPDDQRLRVVLADAALEIQSDEWRGTVDALQVDLYDEEAAAPVLDTPDFYRHCRELLSQQGCMTVNLFGRSSSYAESVEKICAAFGEDAVWAFKPTREGNAIVLAQRTASRPSREALMSAATAIEDKWGLPAQKWFKVFKPLTQ